MAFQLVASRRMLLSTSARIPGALLRHAATTTPTEVCTTAATCNRLKLNNVSGGWQHRKHIHSTCCLSGTDDRESTPCAQCKTVQQRAQSAELRRPHTSPYGVWAASYSDWRQSSHVIFTHRHNVQSAGRTCRSNLLSQYTPLTCTKLDIVVRLLHVDGSGGLRKDESKVEQTVKVLKSEIETKKDATKVTAMDKQKSTQDVAVKDAATKEVATAPPKKTIMQKVVAELKHYYNGFKLLFIDVNVCAKYIWRVLNGQSLTRRERRQLVRTTSDMFRLVPFLVFIIIPFMEFLLPVALKLFPSMLPSTFQEADKKVEKVRNILKVKLEMAKFLQDTIEETAVQREDADGQSAQQFVEFMEKIRTSGEQASNSEIMKYSKLFEDEITLDNLKYQQLAALCRLLEIPPVGPSVLLRFQLQLKLRQLEADDLMIQKEGINSLAEWELQDASRMRGMRSLGVPKERLKLQLEQWLDLHLNEKIPASLLLLSRTLYIPEKLSPSEQLVATIRELPETTMEEAKVKISEVTGDRVDNKTKLEIIQKEEEAIREEIEEKVKLEEQAEKQKQIETAESLEKLSLAPEDIKPVAPSAIETPQLDIPANELLKDIAKPIEESKDEALYDIVEEISSKDLEHLEDALEQVADEKKGFKLEQQDLDALKEDVHEYQETLEDLKEVIVATGAKETVLKESKGATRLSKQVERMISQMDAIMTSLNTEKDTLLENIELQEVKIKRNPKLRDDTDLRQTMLNKISEEKEDLVTINELLLAIRRLQKVSHDTKLQTIVQVLDQDRDGCIDINNALKVIELLGRENVKINPQQMADITKLLEAEQKVEEDIQKTKQEKRAAEELQELKEKSSSSPDKP